MIRLRSSAKELGVLLWREHAIDHFNVNIHLRKVAQVVCHQQGREIATFRQAQDELDLLRTALLIEGAGRFIHHQYRRRAHQGAGDVDPPPAFGALVLLDLQFPGSMQGVEATRRLRELDSSPYVLILTNYATDSDILDAIEAGASGYLLKDAPPGDILGAVRAAAQGESALAPTVVSRLMQRVHTPGDILSPREIEMLQLVADGRSNAEIGAELFLTESTVKSHLVHVFGKLRVTSRTSAVAAAREKGLTR